jgi:signal transduction histidine kinase
VFALVVTAFVIDRLLDYPTTLAFVGVVLVFHAIGTELPPRRSLLLGGSVIAFLTVFTVLGTVTLESIPPAAAISTALTTIVPLVLGREVHQRRRRIEDLEVRAELAERDREERARQAVDEERARIGRELHDVVAHQMTVVLLQADGARRIARDCDARVTDALDTIRAAGHAAQTEMRRMVGLLRAPVDDSAALTPLPTLADLPALVDHVRAADVPVDLHIDGDARPLADGTELSVYRLIQESLTNAVRHGGPGVTARVSLAYGVDVLEVLVTDDGQGGSADAPEGEGHGLVGMRERIAVLGGRFSAGPRPNGGFRVHATIPVQPAVAGS